MSQRYGFDGKQTGSYQEDYFVVGMLSVERMRCARVTLRCMAGWIQGGSFEVHLAPGMVSLTKDARGQP